MAIENCSCEAANVTCPNITNHRPQSVAGDSNGVGADRSGSDTSTGRGGVGSGATCTSGAVGRC